jgi:hypothetical protein
VHAYVPVESFELRGYADQVAVDLVTLDGRFELWREFHQVSYGGFHNLSAIVD